MYINPQDSLVRSTPTCSRDVPFQVVLVHPPQGIYLVCFLQSLNAWQGVWLQAKLKGRGINFQCIKLYNYIINEWVTKIQVAEISLTTRAFLFGLWLTYIGGGLASLMCPGMLGAMTPNSPQYKRSRHAVMLCLILSSTLAKVSGQVLAIPKGYLSISCITCMKPHTWHPAWWKGTASSWALAVSLIQSIFHCCSRCSWTFWLQAMATEPTGSWLRSTNCEVNSILFEG